MTLAEKFYICVEYLALKDYEIANKLEMSKSMFSQLKTKNYKKIKKFHLYALLSAFDLPKSIVEDENINSEEKLLSLLKNSNKKQIDDPNVKSILNTIKGKWYIYNYHSVSDNIFESIIEFKWDKATVYNNTDGNFFYEGYIIDIDDNKIMLKFNREMLNFSVYLTFDNKYIEDKVFFGIITTKTDIQEYNLIEFALITKNKIDLNIVKYLLKNREENQLILDNSFLRNLLDYKLGCLNLDTKEEHNILENLKDYTHFYIYDKSAKYKVTIKEIKYNYNKIELFRGKDLKAKGFIHIGSKDIIMIFESLITANLIVFKINRGNITGKGFIFSYFGHSRYNSTEISGYGICTKGEISFNLAKNILEPKDNAKSLTNEYKHLIEMRLKELLF